MSSHPNRRRLDVLVALGLLLVVTAIGIIPSRGNASLYTSASLVAPAQGDTSGSVQGIEPFVSRSIKNDTSIPLRDMKPSPFMGEVGDHENLRVNPNPPQQVEPKDPIVQSSFGPAGLTIPTPVVNFEGISNQWGVYPPDTNGDVGPNHYFLTVNLGFRIFDKSGNPLTAVLNNNTLWSGFGGLCQSTNSGDPVVLYDPLA